MALWVRRFEAYCRAVKTPQDRMCDSLLALLDDAGVRSEHVQEALLRTPPATLNDTRTAAKREEVAQTARKLRRARRVATCVVSSGEGLTDVTPGTTTGQRSEVAAIGTGRDDLKEAVRRNTETLERLLSQLTRPHGLPSSRPTNTRPRRGPSGPGVCWCCGQSVHPLRVCPSGNAPRPGDRDNRRPRAL